MINNQGMVSKSADTILQNFSRIFGSSEVLKPDANQNTKVMNDDFCVYEASYCLENCLPGDIVAEVASK